MKTALILASLVLALGLAGCSTVDSCASLTDSQKQAAFSQTAVGASGFGSGLAYGNRDLAEGL
jgi:hypothetical protein